MEVRAAHPGPGHPHQCFARAGSASSRVPRTIVNCRSSNRASVLTGAVPLATQTGGSSPRRLHQGFDHGGHGRFATQEIAHPNSTAAATVVEQRSSHAPDPDGGLASSRRSRACAPFPVRARTPTGLLGRALAVLGRHRPRRWPPHPGGLGAEGKLCLAHRRHRAGSRRRANWPASGQTGGRACQVGNLITVEHGEMGRYPERLGQPLELRTTLRTGSSSAGTRPRLETMKTKPVKALFVGGTELCDTSALNKVRALLLGSLSWVATSPRSSARRCGLAGPGSKGLAARRGWPPVVCGVPPRSRRSPGAHRGHRRMRAKPVLRAASSWMRPRTCCLRTRNSLSICCEKSRGRAGGRR